VGLFIFCILFRYFGVLPGGSGNRRLDTAQNTALLLEAVALVQHQDSVDFKARNKHPYRHPCGPGQRRPVGDVPKIGRSYRFDQPMSEGSRFIVCQRTVGKASLSFLDPKAIDRDNSFKLTKDNTSKGIGGSNVFLASVSSDGEEVNSSSKCRVCQCVDKECRQVVTSMGNSRREYYPERA